MSSSLLRLDLEKAKNLIEVTGKLTIGVTAICYVLGLVVINIYLSKYSVYSLGLFRLNYVTAGMLTLAPVLFGLITFVMTTALIYPLVSALRRKAHSFFSHSEELPSEFGELALILLFILLMVIPAGVTYLTFYATGVPTDGIWAIVVAAAIAANSLCAVATCFGILLAPQSYARQVILVIVPAVAALVVVGHAVFFASFLFEKVPPHLGGGEPKAVELFVGSAEGRALLEDAEVEFEKDTHRATNVRLLFSTDNEYILLVKVPLNDREQAVTVKRELIQGIRPRDTFPVLGGD